jgi:hypothetical protein
MEPVRTRTQNPVLLWVMGLLLVFVQFGCTPIKLVSDYDDVIDKGVSAVQRDTETFLVKLESSPGDERAPVAGYEANVPFYRDMKVSVSALRVRADATDRNSLTVQMLDKFQSNMNAFEAAHKEGMKKYEVPYFRGGFNSQITAILTFELAKKRGEKPDSVKAAAPPTPAISHAGVIK